MRRRSRRGCSGLSYLKLSNINPLIQKRMPTTFTVDNFLPKSKSPMGIRSKVTEMFVWIAAKLIFQPAR